MATDHYKEIGDYLKDCREGLGFKMEDVSDQLKIRMKYLEAIEKGNLDALPGSIYTEGYLKNYAEYLQLDPKDVIRKYKNGGANDDEEIVEEFNLPQHDESSSMRPSKRLIIYSFLAIVAVYMGWNYFSENKESIINHANILLESNPLSEEEVDVMGVRAGKIGVDEVQDAEALSIMDGDSNYALPGFVGPKQPEDLESLEKAIKAKEAEEKARAAEAEAELGWKKDAEDGEEAVAEEE